VEAARDDVPGLTTVLPRFRSALAEGLYLTAGVERCLHILTPQAWQVMAESIATLPWLDPSARQVQRNLFALATHVVPDKLGRIVIPHYLRSYAELGTDVVVAGVYDRIEVWDRAAWEQLRGDFIERGVEQVQGLSELLRRPASGA
jgi:MraZ protein